MKIIKKKEEGKKKKNNTNNKEKKDDEIENNEILSLEDDLLNRIRDKSNSNEINKQINCKNKKEEKEKLERDSIKANIGVAKSVEDTNKNTVTFYNNQTDFNTWQKWLTIAIFAATAVQAWVAGCNYIYPISSGKETHIDTATHNQQLRVIKESIQSQTSRLDTFEKAVKDSLNMK